MTLVSSKTYFVLQQCAEGGARLNKFYKRQTVSVCATAHKMRIQYKGGVWKNTEDEILKAAVMKYGMNQWARIASLLVRKSAKQCKARWFEWLDPNIKKTPWTREEEERLLHLAKIMPTQWRTIAPMIGRTAAQCLEHYERLLDQAQGGDGIADAARARDAEFNAESKPARPDPVDMDEDELEMLSEARARLANTKGKKAKRKAREKQLEVAKRVAHLQKRRELKAAGINLKPRRRDRRQPDFAVEIPFARAPAPGFYDTRDEVARGKAVSTDIRAVGKNVREFESGKREIEEARARRQDEKRRKVYEEKNPEAAIAEPVVEQIEPVLKGRPLNLPKPQVSDAELEAIAKAGQLFAGKRGAPTNGITDELVPERNPALSTPGSAAGSSSAHLTPASEAPESWTSERQRHLETILGLHKTDTPLMGGQNTPVPTSVTDDPSATPRTTPNPLATPSELSVATIGTVGSTKSISSSSSKWKKAQKAKTQLLKKQVQDRLDRLAKPGNDYSFDVAAMEELEDDDENESKDVEMVEDAEEEEKRLAVEGQKALKRAKRQVLSSAARRGLPKPDELWIGSEKFAKSSLQRLVLQDITVEKVLQDGKDGDEAKTAAAVKSVADVSLPNEGAQLRRALALIRAEAESSQLKVSDIEEALRKRDETMMSSKWIVTSDDEMRQVETAEDEARYEADVQVFSANAQKAEGRLEKKMEKLTKGFEKRFEAAQKAIAEECQKKEDIDMQISCIEMLEKHEEVAIKSRLKEWEERLREQRELHTALQAQYAK